MLADKRFGLNKRYTYDAEKDEMVPMINLFADVIRDSKHEKPKSLKDKTFDECAKTPLPNWLYDKGLELLQEKNFVKLMVDLHNEKIRSKSEDIIKDALNGDFSYFGSSSDIPITDLHNRLVKIDANELAEKVKNGSYGHYWVYYK